MTVDPELRPGQLLGHYVIERRLGRGGMGIVYLADDRRVGREVAIKVVRPDLLDDSAIAARFRRERNNQAGVSHPNILPLLDSGWHGEMMYFVTPFQRKGDLRALLARRRITAAQLTHIVWQVADALSAAHQSGIVHRDVKPGNILVANEDGPSVYLADFGLSRRVTDTRLTGTGAMLGTVWYMAPEQYAGEPTTPATDVYALAVTTHEIATGECRCDASCDDFPEVVTRLCEVVRKGTARRPGQRHANPHELASAVAAAIGGDDALLLPVGDDERRASPGIPHVSGTGRHRLPEIDPPADTVRPAADSGTGPATIGQQARTEGRSLRVRLWLLAGALVLTLVASAGVAVLVRLALSTPEPPPAATADAPTDTPAGSSTLVVCTEDVTVRDRPTSFEEGARSLGTLYQGDQFLAYPGEDSRWARGYAYKLGTEGWLQRGALRPSC